MRYRACVGGGDVKSAILANAALCVCPPLIATATVITVPAARHAAHKLTSPPHHHVGKKHSARPPCSAVKELTSAALPTSGDAVPAAPATAEEALPDLAAAGNSVPPGKTLWDGDAGINLAGPGPFTGTPGRPTSPVAPVIEPAGVPEPASWIMMITGFYCVGMLCRWGKRPRRRTAKLAQGAAATIELLSNIGLASGQTAAIASTKTSSAIGASLGVAVAKKAAVCVCSGAILATAVTTVPPLKRAIYTATMPARPLLNGNCQPRA